MPTKLVRGDRLTYGQRQTVLAAFNRRWTRDNPMRGAIYGQCPSCKVVGGAPSENNVPCRQFHPTIPLVSDDEWLRQHAFYFTANGLLGPQGHCEPAYMAK